MWKRSLSQNGMKVHAKDRSEASLPDFIIGGAMKSGTSTLHRLLAKHENIFIPGGEIHFFDLDEVEQHADFFDGSSGQWQNRNYDAHFEENLAWYERFFEEARTEQRVGEDSTTYLPSSRAPRRIRELLPDVKLIFLLRDPVARTYSHYWHNVRKGRSVYRFEEQLRYAPSTLLQRSFYKRQIERYLDVFPSDQIKVILFEAFVENMQRTIDEVCRFIGVAPTLNVEKLNTHRNRSPAPRHAGLQIAANRLLRMARKGRYAGHLPGAASSQRRSLLVRVATLARKVVNRFNLTDRPYPPMRDETRSFLQRLFARENTGLADLVEADLTAHWPTMKVNTSSDVASSQS
jgi:hypothetical protein